MRLWPTNVWIGTTAENQEQWDIRLPQLMGIPAPVRFVSAEPLLGPIKLNDMSEGPYISALVPDLRARNAASS